MSNSGDSQASKRLVDQACRNSIVDVTHILAEGDAGVRSVGFGDFFEYFYDWMDRDGRPWPNSAMTVEEHAALLRVCDIVDEACKNTPPRMSEEAFIETGWPTRIASEARKAVELFAERGLFSTDIEQDEPDTPHRWPAWLQPYRR